jgi:hypothetical protein
MQWNRTGASPVGSGLNDDCLGGKKMTGRIGKYELIGPPGVIVCGVELRYFATSRNLREKDASW